MTHNDSMHRGQANAGSGIFGRSVQPLEWTKQLVGVFHVEARAVVSHKEHVFAVENPAAEFNLGYWLLAREFEGVAQKILQHQTEQTVIARGSNVRFDP